MPGPSSSRLGVVAVLACVLWGAGCGGAPEPREQDIWHRSQLRPGRVPAETKGEQELLARLGDVPTGEPVTVAGQVFVVDAPYAAASGRTCRSITVRGPEGEGQPEVKLACDGPGGWELVPDPFAQDAVVGRPAP